MTSATYEVDPAAKRVTITFSRGVTYKEWHQILDSVFADPRFVPGSGLLIDRRTAPVPESKTIWEVARYIDRCEAAGATRGWALVVSDLGSFGMGRMAQEVSDFTNSIGVFHQMEAGNHWLDERKRMEANPRRSKHSSVA